MRNLLIALAGFAARSVLAEDDCGAQPTKPSGVCWTEEAYFYQVEECNPMWETWDNWCYCQMENSEGWYLDEDHICT